MNKTDLSQWSGILIYIECRLGQMHPVTAELIGEALRIARNSGEHIYAVAAGKNMQELANQLAVYPLCEVLLYETQDEYNPLLYETILCEAIDNWQPSIVLVGGTLEGRALAPRGAVAFRTGLTADCTSLSLNDEGNLVQTRPAFGGNIMASILTPYSRPQFVTVRPGVMDPIELGSGIAAGKTKFHYIRKEADNKQVQICSIRQSKESEGITGARVLIVAGRGIKKKDDLDMLRTLAESLGARLASSRALVEKGWMSPAEQIGLSGNTVHPEYMITCGVSGTVQFMAGMKRTKNIIAINTDPNARIFDIAHYPICGDVYEIVPELTALFKNGEGDDIPAASL